MTILLTFLRTYWKELALVFLLISYSWYWEHHGASRIQAKWDADKAIVQHQADVQRLAYDNLIAEYESKAPIIEEKIKIIKEKGDDVLIQVPKYISKKANDECPVPVGFVSLYNGAITGNLPTDITPGDFDATATGIGLADIARTSASNFTKYRQVKEQLIELIAWEKKRGALSSPESRH